MRGIFFGDDVYPGKRSTTYTGRFHHNNALAQSGNISKSIHAKADWVQEKAMKLTSSR